MLQFVPVPWVTENEKFTSNTTLNVQRGPVEAAGLYDMPADAGMPQKVDALYVIVTGPAVSPAPTIGSDEIVQHDDAEVVPAMDAVQLLLISTCVEASVSGRTLEGMEELIAEDCCSLQPASATPSAAITQHW
ncbi:MAG TPA: hypothetical protein VGF98_10975 [Candidatus Tumulicola sp.]|jgi:hypothetical protein